MSPIRLVIFDIAGTIIGDHGEVLVSDHLKTYIFERLPTACCRIRGLRGSGIAGNGSIHRL
jgi:hypothetical protein